MIDGDKFLATGMKVEKKDEVLERTVTGDGNGNWFDDVYITATRLTHKFPLTHKATISNIREIVLETREQAMEKLLREFVDCGPFVSRDPNPLVLAYERAKALLAENHEGVL